MDIELKNLRIKNYRSVRVVDLPLEKLTIIAGANASGKSNILDAMQFVASIIQSPSISKTALSHLTWNGGGDNIHFELQMLADGTIPISYLFTLSIQPLAIENESGVDTIANVLDEQLIINYRRIIKVSNGSGVVHDESDSIQESLYNPSTPKLALQSAGDYGDKPITRAVYQFLRSWVFYDFQPSVIRSVDYDLRFLSEYKSLNRDGSRVKFILLAWSENNKEKFDDVSDSLFDLIGVTLQTQQVDSDKWKLYLHEGYEKLTPFSEASDGMLRLIAYLILLNQDELPPLIAIEEPERNLHPSLLYKLAYLLERLSARTQVVITTHSARLLDMLDPDTIGDELEILLLKNVYGEGTKVINLEEARQNQVALRGWIDDFGIGSAVFESNLIDELEVEYV